MKSQFPLRRILETILNATSSEQEVRDFVEHCYFLALPFIRKKLFLGKLNLNALGLTEIDVVYDCLADLFERDHNGRFIKLSHFFEMADVPLEHLSETEATIALRRLIFGHVNKNIIRLYNEIDPHLGRILRNIKLALERFEPFQIVMVFGEPHLVPRDLDLLKHLPYYPVQELHNDFLRYATIHDNTPTMLNMLYKMLLDQNRFQRSVPLVSFALLVKEVYTAGMEHDEKGATSVDEHVDATWLQEGMRRICTEVGDEMRERYVGGGIVSKEIYQIYVRTVEDILVRSISEEHLETGSYFDFLRKYIPQLDRAAFYERHRSILEYLVKKAKRKARMLPDLKGFRKGGGM